MSKRYVGGIVSTGLDGINYPVKEVEYLVVAGGGGGGTDIGGGGGAGGLLTATGYAVIIGSSITVTVGAGGAGAVPNVYGPPGSSGANSVFGSITSTGGGGGAANLNGGSGGSGGGGRTGTGTGGSGTCILLSSH